MKKLILLATICLTLVNCADVKPSAAPSSKTTSASTETGSESGSGAGAAAGTGAINNPIRATPPLPSPFPDTSVPPLPMNPTPSNVNNQEIVIKAYMDIFDRTLSEISYDKAGVAYWVARLDAGYPLSSFKNDLYASDEYYVRGLYQSILRRRADWSGLIYYLEAIRDGETTRAKVKAELLYVCRQRVTECR